MVWLAASLSWAFAVVGTPLALFIAYANGMKTIPKYRRDDRIMSVVLPIGSLLAGFFCAYQIVITSSSWWYFALIAPPTLVSALLTGLIFTSP